MKLNLPRFITLSEDQVETLIEHLCFAEDNEELMAIGREIHEQVYVPRSDDELTHYRVNADGSKTDLSKRSQ